MKVAIVLTRVDEKITAKELISAAERTGSKETEFWIFGEADRFVDGCVQNIITIRDDGPRIAERYLPVLKELLAERQPDIVLFSGNCLGDELAIRLGCIAEGSCASSITKIRQHKNGIIICRRVFGYLFEGEFMYEKPPYVFSVSKGSFTPVEYVGNSIILESKITMPDISYFENYEEVDEKEETGLGTFDVVLCGGRGLGSKSAMGRLQKLGELLGAGVGATRPVVLNAWLPMGKLIGLSGVVIKPNILIAFGVSGSTPFIKGVEKSKLLIAINNDDAATIFKHCDIGLIGDCIEAVEVLLKRFDPTGGNST